MPSSRSKLAKEKSRCLELRGKFSWQPWLCAAFVLVLPIALACCSTLLFPGQAALVRNIFVSAAGGDARYWAAGHWRADAITLDAVRHWMFDPEPAATVIAEPTAPPMLASTNSGSLKSTA